MIHKHRDEGENDFMISTAALSKLLGGSREAEMRATRLQTEKGIGRFGEVNALAFLCGVVVVSRPVALHGVGDGVGCKARRIFDLFDLRQRGALNCHELSVCLLTLARALEAFLKLTEEGHVSELFREKDSKIYMGLEGLDRAAKLALRKWDAPDDYDSAEESEDEEVGHVGMKDVIATADDDDQSVLVEKKEKKEKTLERERFVAWSRRLLAPGCRPPAVLDALRPVWKSKFYGAFVLNHRVVLHAIDAMPARWRGDAGSSPLERARTAASSPRNDLVHPTYWLISTQVTTIIMQKNGAGMDTGAAMHWDANKDGLVCIPWENAEMHVVLTIYGVSLNVDNVGDEED